MTKRAKHLKRARHAAYMRRWRTEQERRAWFPRFGVGVAGLTARFDYIRSVGGPDATNLGSSLLSIVTRGTSST